jgi:hypothetical protein
VRDVEALRVVIAVAADRLGPVTVLVNNPAHDVRVEVSVSCGVGLRQ